MAEFSIHFIKNYSKGRLTALNVKYAIPTVFDGQIMDDDDITFRVLVKGVFTSF